jgi:hypothetical protein
MNIRYECADCGLMCNEDELLTAENPFDPADTVTGCPECKSVESFVRLCDVAGCMRHTSCGWPSTTGYRHTCGYHMEYNK